MNLDTNAVLAAFMLTLFAGLSTGIGSLIAWFAKKTNTRFLSIVLGFSAGVMIYVSMIEIFSESRLLLTTALGESAGSWLTVAGFFGGMLIIGLIDRFVPSADNPHEMHLVEEMAEGGQGECAIEPVPDCKKRKRRRRRMNGLQATCPHQVKLMRLGFFTALAIGIHNFPEGIATFVSALKDPSLGVTIAVAIAIHNIPEGIAVSVPVYYATGNRRKAFRWSLLSGLAEPLGALVAFFILLPIMNDILFGIVFACVAGIMVFISLDEILPTAREYGEPHLSIYGMVAGMAIMAVSLQLFL